MGTDKDKLFFKNYDFGRVLLNIVITVSIYLSFFTVLIFQNLNWLIFLIIFLIIAFLLTLFPFKKKILSYFALILLLFPILLLLLSPLALPPKPGQPPAATPYPTPFPAATPYPTLFPAAPLHEDSYAPSNINIVCNYNSIYFSAYTTDFKKS